MWGFAEQDLGARRRPPNPFEREPSESRVLIHKPADAVWFVEGGGELISSTSMAAS
jgi:hypothetical protein